MQRSFRAKSGQNYSAATASSTMSVLGHTFAKNCIRKAELNSGVPTFQEPRSVETLMSLMHRCARYWVTKTLTFMDSAKSTSSFKRTHHSPDVQGLTASSLGKKRTTFTSIALIVGSNTVCSVRCPGILSRAAKSIKYRTKTSQRLSSSSWWRECNNAVGVAMSSSGVKVATT